MKKLYSLLILSCLAFSGFAQTAASYSFSAFTAPYSSIAATGTTVPTIIGDDIAQMNIPIGFTFVYCGVGRTQLAMSSNGILSFANSGAAPWSDTGPGTMPAGGVGCLMPYWSDLYGGLCVASKAYYQTTGVAPNRVFTAEWKDFNAFAWGGVCSCCIINMQCKLYEGTNIIDFCYSNSTLSGMGGTSGVLIGIANSTADWQTLNNDGAAPTPSAAVWNNHTITDAPAANQVYRWYNQCTDRKSVV